jgi:hypothetical protein
MVPGQLGAQIPGGPSGGAHICAAGSCWKGVLFKRPSPASLVTVSE